ncbi:MAG: hypothetical protein LBO63_01505 [Oscillospiraceae bacterium]|nr:hypothetical protein [Oscillospiraceae bacterium]
MEYTNPSGEVTDSAALAAPGSTAASPTHIIADSRVANTRFLIISVFLLKSFIVKTSKNWIFDN